MSGNLYFRIHCIGTISIEYEFLRIKFQMTSDLVFLKYNWWGHGPNE